MEEVHGGHEDGRKVYLSSLCISILNSSNSFTVTTLAFGSINRSQSNNNACKQLANLLPDSLLFARFSAVRRSTRSAPPFDAVGRAQDIFALVVAVSVETCQLVSSRRCLKMMSPFECI